MIQILKFQSLISIAFAVCGLWSVEKDVGVVLSVTSVVVGLGSCEIVN